MSESVELLEAFNQWMDRLPWVPQEGPQEAAYLTQADVTLYGGAAGGGKTDLAIGLAITQHRETLFIRREATQLESVLDRLAQLIDPDRKGWSGQSKRWRIPRWDGHTDRQIMIGSTPALGDENKYQGRPRDLLVIDEAANMLYAQVRFLMGWVRSTVKGQRCRTLLCSNPPTSDEGAWIVEMFAPWLDPNHPNPAVPGELRWYATIDGEEVPVKDGTPFDHNGERIIPQSRTFIPAKLDDNRYLRDSGYRATLQALPEPLRSQMLYGDFMAGKQDDEYQVIPSEWVELAQKRWTERRFQNITNCGVDPSRGGTDDTVAAYRTGWHFHPLRRWPGVQMKTGDSVAAKVVEEVGTTTCPVHVDVIGIGAAVVDALERVIGSRTVPVNVAEGSEAKDWSGNLEFFNRRAELWWNMRDLLNPANGQDVELPPDSRLAAELCSVRYTFSGAKIKVESKKDVIKRLGRSTDSADAVLLCAERVAGAMRIQIGGRGKMSIRSGRGGQR